MLRKTKKQTASGFTTTQPTVTGSPKSNIGKQKVDKLREVKQNPNKIAT
jgi:hypothetical protein